MKKKVWGLALVLAILMSVIVLFTGCSEKYQNIVVYINDGLSDSKITMIEDKLKEFDNVNSVQYTSKENAYEKAEEKLGHDALKMAGYTKSFHPFPASFTLEVKKEKSYEALIKEIENIDGVGTVEVESNTKVKDLVNAEMNYIKNQM